jgi:hypothetical protein
MSLQAHTNKPGTIPKWDEYHKSYHRFDGWTWFGSTWFRTKHSHKSAPVYPEWLRSDGVVVFKKPSGYLRVVDNRTNPTINGVEYDLSGKYIGTYVNYASDNMGNHASLADLPRIMQNNSDYPFVDGNQIRRAEVECLLKFKEDGVALGNALAEAKSTVDMFAQNASKLAGALLAVKRGNWRVAYNNLGGRGGVSKFAADNYLQWKFGWSPLMTDIRDGVELLKRQLQQDNKIVRNVRNLEYENSWEYEIGSNVSGRPNRVSGKGTNATKVALWCRFKPDKWRQAAEAYGLDDPLGVLWEVTPWSFVVDWVLPVGNLLAALAVRERLDFVGGYYSVRAQGQNRIQVPSLPSPRVENSVTATVDRFGFVRVPYSTLPFPLPYVKSPFSTSHTQTALALLRQLVR